MFLIEILLLVVAAPLLKGQGVVCMYVCVCNVCIILCISHTHEWCSALEGGGQVECCPLGCNEIWCDVVWCDVYTQCCPMEFAYRVERDVTCGASVYTGGLGLVHFSGL